MGGKRKSHFFHYWVGERHADTIEISIKDPNGSSIDTWKANIKDLKTCGKILDIIKKKYNFYPNVSFLKDKKRDKDLDWVTKKKELF